MRPIIFEIENAWLENDYDRAKLLAASITNEVRDFSDEEKEYILPKLERIYAHTHDLVSAANFLILNYRYLEARVSDGTLHSSALYSALRELRGYINQITDRPRAVGVFAEFLEDKFDELPAWNYDYPGIKDCIADAIFTCELGNTRLSLNIIDIGLQKVMVPKNEEMLLRLKARVEGMGLN